MASREWCVDYCSWCLLTLRQAALNEAKILSMFDHPNIISYYDCFEEVGSYSQHQPMILTLPEGRRFTLSDGIC